MTEQDVANYWNQNAEAWATLTRAGCDVCRDAYNTPTFLKMLPSISGLAGLDIGCGEGHNTRLFAQLGARIHAVDIAVDLLRFAIEEEQRLPRGILYQAASASALPFADSSFDFVVSTMCFMDFPNQEQAIAEVFRVLKPGGFFQFSITHPATNTPVRYWIMDEQGQRRALAIAGYFDPPQADIEQWIFGNAPDELKTRFPKFQVPRFQRTLSGWINLVSESGLRIEQAEEPHPDAAALARHPREYDATLIPMFLILRARKPLDA